MSNTKNKKIMCSDSFFQFFCKEICLVDCCGFFGYDRSYADGKLIDKNLPGYFDISYTIFVNASHVNEHYELVNEHVRIIL